MEESIYIIENRFNYEFSYLDKNKTFIVSNDNIEIDFTTLPTEITNIKFECDYEFPLNNLPAHIESLILYYNYNIELTNLPSNLKCLVLGIQYNKPLYYLPESLEILTIDSDYSYDLLHLPKAIKKLSLALEFNIYLNFDLPNLSTLDLKHSNFIYSNTVNIKCINKLQNSLKELYLPNYYRPSLSMENVADTLEDTLELEKFTTLEILSIGLQHLCKYIKKFPINLKKLILGDTYNHPLDNLPIKLEYLGLGYNFNNNLSNLPKTLKALDLNDNNICNILINYPESLETIRIIETYPQKQLLCEYIKKKNSNIKIILKPDWDEREQNIDDYRNS